MDILKRYERAEQNKPPLMQEDIKPGSAVEHFVLAFFNNRIRSRDTLRIVIMAIAVLFFILAFIMLLVSGIL